VPDDTTTESPPAEEPRDLTESSDERGRARKKRNRSLLEWGAIVVAALVVSLVMRAYVVQTFYIPSGSMEPTLLVGDRVVVSKLSATLGTMHRGDIVVFYSSKKAQATCAPPAEPIYIKRVIGLPGDVVTSKGNTIYVNHHVLVQNYTHDPILGTPIGTVRVKANHYFLMGDNREQSCDSRYWGTVPKSAIIGKAFIRIWPLSRFRFL
jgi:signal peptidase I